MKYRTDIDGLRAAAVAAVIFYHLQLPGFSGGFVGVDIFFVISGFLITSLIANEHAQGRFSIIKFYVRRVRRIFPALFTVLAAALLAAPFILLPHDLRHFGESLVAMAGFSSNIQFWLQSGYFSPAALTIPLLHTWSLSVEEQFYLAYPLLFLCLQMCFPYRVRLALAAIALLSLAASIWMTATSPAAAFYLPQYRIWEFLLGGIAALGFTAPRAFMAAEAVAVAGFAMILAPVLFYSPSTPFPGIAALVPTVGALLILVAGDNSRIVIGPVLRSPPVVFLGRISYSLYLWHWPLIVLASYWFARELRPMEKVVVLGLTLALSSLSWKWVEQPGRFALAHRKLVFGAAAAAIMVCAAAGSAIYLLQGLPGRFPNAETTAATDYGGACFLGAGNDRWSPQRCTYPAKQAGAPAVFLWGDSFAAHYHVGLRSLQGSTPFNLVQATRAGCRPLPSLDADGPACAAFNRRALAAIIHIHPRLVILSARWDYVADQAILRAALGELVRDIRRSGSRVLIVGVSPTYIFDAAVMAAAQRRDGSSSFRHKPVASGFATEATLREIASKNGAVYFTSNRYLCEGNLCRYSDGRLLHSDNRHLSSHGSAVVVRYMQQTIKEMLRPER